MATSTHVGSLHVTENLTAGSMGVASNSVTDTSVIAGANIAASKLEHQIHLTYNQTGSAASATIPIHCGYGDGEVISIKAYSVVAALTTATVTVDLKKNGTTVLTGVITLDNGNTAYIPETGTLGTATYSNDEVLTLVIVAAASGGTLPTGLGVTVILREDAAP